MFKALLTALNSLTFWLFLISPLQAQANACQEALEQLSSIPKDSPLQTAVRRFYFEKHPSWINGRRIQPTQKFTFKGHEILVFHELQPLLNGERRYIAVMGPAIFELREIPPTARFSLERIHATRSRLRNSAIDSLYAIGELELSGRKFVMFEHFPRLTETQLRKASPDLGLTSIQISEALSMLHEVQGRLRSLSLTQLDLTFDGSQWRVETPLTWGME